MPDSRRGSPRSWRRHPLRLHDRPTPGYTIVPRSPMTSLLAEPTARAKSASSGARGTCCGASFDTGSPSPCARTPPARQAWNLRGRRSRMPPAQGPPPLSSNPSTSERVGQSSHTPTDRTRRSPSRTPHPSLYPGGLPRSFRLITHTSLNPQRSVRFPANRGCPAASERERTKRSFNDHCHWPFPSSPSRCPARRISGRLRPADKLRRASLASLC